MDEQRIIEIKRKVATLLHEEKLKQALNLLGEELDGLSDWDLRSSFADIETAYSYMLEYFSKGMPDPDRERLYNELLGRCFIINDAIALSRRAEKLFDIYSQHRRKYKNETAADIMRVRLSENTANIAVTGMLPKRESEIIEKELKDEHEKILAETFHRIWCSNCWKGKDIENITQLLNDEDITPNDRSSLVSAITLGTLKCFEPAKVILLCRLAQNVKNEIAIRALIGVILSIYTYSDRLKYYPEITAALQTLVGEPNIQQRILTIQLQLLRSRETQKIDRKMREEIIPAMMKNPRLDGSKMGVDLVKELEEEGQNPEWEAWIEQDKIKDKLEEMSKWQIEGADVYMSTFSQLKGYPFFEEFSNWLRPFDSNVPQISDIIPRDERGSKSLMGAICSSRFFCNSDKYSFCLTFKQVPKEQQDMLMQQITGEADIAKEGPETTTDIPKEKDAELIGNQYIQDLYRFFKISKFKKEIDDPFAQPLNILLKEPIAFLLSERECALRVFDYLVEKEYYHEAYAVGTKCEKRGLGNSFQFYQKMGYSLQKMGEYRKAIDYFTKADIINPDTLWNMRRLAQCYRLLGDFKNALHFYESAEKIAHENLSLLMQCGECYTLLKKYDDAFSRFFKVEYLENESVRAWRAIAWCSFLAGKDEQARKYYNKIFDSSKTKGEDIMNAGHVEWVNGNKEQAIALYRKAKEAYGCNIYNNIINDKEILLSRGANEFELNLLRDIIDE
ncbi:MAG: tetratricopeptide repeat protein [Bacteroidaceae bacterium]|nr:tetratricopeptide repeat protein [Bacteroidaceae bacterium]